MTQGLVVTTSVAASANAPLTVGTEAPLLLDQFGRLIVTVASATPPTGTLATEVQGNVASDSANIGNPVGVGGVAVTAPSGLPAAVTVGDRVASAYDLTGRQLVVPVSSSGVKTQLVAAGTAAAAAGAWTSSGVVSLDAGAWRRLRLLLDLDSQAVGNVVGLIVLGAFTLAAPGPVDDEWFSLSTTDGTWTSAVLAGTLPNSQDFSIAPNWFSGTVRGSVLQSPATLNLADELRLAFPVVDLAGVRHFQVLYAETGITGTPSQIGLWYSLSM